MSRYNGTAIVLHWLIAIAILCQITFGWYLDEIPRGTPERSTVINLHKSIGITLGLVVLFRVFWRVTHAPPSLPSSMPAWERTIARANHFGLYACMLIMPIAGYIASNFSKYGVKFFGVIALAPWGNDDKRIYDFFTGVHTITSYIFVALIALHVGAALLHLVRRDGIFTRMWPRPSN